MPSINRVLDDIIRQVGQAIVDMDSFSVRVAKSYANNKLLSKLAAPKLRISSLDMDVKFSFSTKKTTKLDDSAKRKITMEVERIVSESTAKLPQIMKIRNDGNGKLWKERIKNLKQKLEDEVPIETEIKHPDVFVSSLASLTSNNLSDFIIDSQADNDTKIDFKNKVNKVFKQDVEQEIRAAIGMILEEYTIEDPLDVNIDTSKLSLLKPEQISTFKISLSQQDLALYTMKDQNGEIVEYADNY